MSCASGYRTVHTMKTLLKKATSMNLSFKSRTTTTLAPFLAKTDNPRDLVGPASEGKWYDVKPEAIDHLNFSWNLPLNLHLRLECYGEMRMMSRQCSAQLFEYLNASVSTQTPIVRYVLYGKRGTGKTMALLQAMHYGYTQGFVLVHIKNAMSYRSDGDFLDWNVSEWNPERVDQPILAAKWLVEFSRHNAQHTRLFSQLKTTKDYVWDQKHTTPAGSTILDLIQTGTTTSKYASDCIGAVLRELKHHCSEGRAKVLVTVDTGNVMYFPSLIRRKDRITRYDGLQVSVLRHFAEMFTADWRNGAAVMVVDCKPFRSVDKTDGEKINGENLVVPTNPLGLLGEQGFDALDPFVPIHIRNYTKSEMESLLDYYLYTKWLQHPEANTEVARKEIAHVCGFNPQLIEKLVATL